MTFPVLTVLGLLPLVVALVLAVTPLGERAAKALGLVGSLLTLVLGAVVVIATAGGDVLAEKVAWIRPIGAWWALGPTDGLSATMVALTVILTPIVLGAAWLEGDRIGGVAEGAEPERHWSAKAFFALVLTVEGLALIAFLATDVFLFFLAFEAILIPMYFLIGGFGGAKRRRAAVQFLLFSLGSGLLMLAAVIGLYVVSARAGQPSFLVSDLAALGIGGDTGRWLFVGFFIAFAFKAPMVPAHTWLPDAAEQATPGTSTMLVGVMDKLGTFGMLRFCLELFPEASRWATPVVIVLALISIFYGALAAIGSKNLMRLVAFTSISHFGFMVLGIFALTTQSISGSVLYMLNHSFSTAALFLVAGFLVRRRGSAEISAFGGVQKVAPVLAGLFLVAGLSSLALPGMSSFVSEFLVLAGTFSRWPAVAAVAVVGIVLAALYILLMYQRTMTGPVTDQVSRTITTDLSGRERFVLAPLVVLILALGFFPKPALDLIEPAVTHTMQQGGVTDPQPTIAKESN